jgi:OPA family glycerol-3-phosphate transporter-like MFS transporter
MSKPAHSRLQLTDLRATGDCVVPGATRADDRDGANGFKSAQFRILLALMFCYLFFYTGRQNFGWVISALNQELGLSPTELGTISGSMLALYGIGQAINGNLGDKFGARWMVTFGALASVILNWATSFGQSFWPLMIFWSLNGYFQSFAWAPGGRLISNWFSRRERGRAFGFYVFSAGFSSVLTFALAILVLQHLAWQWVFRLPVLLLLAGGIVFFIVARDRPQDLGFSAVEADSETNDCPGDQATSLARYACALKNWRFVLASVAIGFESIARYGLLTWVPFHYLGPNWKQDPSGVWITLALPIGMALGGLSSGYVSDRLFHSNRSRPVALYLTSAAICLLVMSAVPRESHLLGIVLLFLAGFLVYGPQSSLWALCPDLLGRENAGTGVGLMDALAYGFAAIGGPVIGFVIQTTGDTASVFWVTAAVCALSTLCILPVRR